MRVTNNITRNTFVKNNRRMRTNMLGSYTRLMTQRRFNRVSEDTVNGTKAMTIRRQLRDLEIYDGNLSSTKQLFTEAEKALDHIADYCYISVEEQLTAATNGTHDQLDMNIFATTLDQLAEQIVNDMNKDFGERQIFGGTNNSSTPFGIGRYCVENEEGTVVYPPYYYDYYVGADKTMEQTAEANEVIAKLADYNQNGKEASDTEISEFSQVFKKLGLTLAISEDKKYLVSTTDQSNEKVTLLSYDGTSTELTCEVDGGDPKTVKLSAGGNVISEQKENEMKQGLTLVDVPRSVTYNGIPVDFDVTRKMTDANGGKFTINDGDKFTLKKLNERTYEWNEGTEIQLDVAAAVRGRDNSLIFPGSKPIYVDIGLGVKYDDNYDVDPQTVIDTSFNGAKILGCGLDSDGYSKNLAQLVLEAARTLRNGDQATPNAIIDKANKANQNILMEMSNLGSKYNSIEFYESKNTDSKFNLRERQNIVEGTDMEYEISYWENLMAAYDASLKVGTQIIPNSIFNYI